MDIHLQPYIVHEEKSYIAVYKPPKMHTVPLKQDDSDTLLSWCVKLFPEVLTVSGKKPIEGGVIHRLDYETHGLVLIARTKKTMDSLLEQQQKDLFIKQYTAKTKKLYFFPNKNQIEGFPPLPDNYNNLDSAYPKIICSGFRPFGVGRKSIRPVVNKNSTQDLVKTYYTKIIESKLIDALNYQRNFTVQLCRGFRHQIRCHLAWLGYPIINDPIYGYCKDTEMSIMELEANSFSFYDPETNKPISIAL